MSRFDVHTGMRGRQAADAHAEKLLAGDAGDPVLSAFVAEVRGLATVEAPVPAGDLAVLLTEGFVPEPAPAAVAVPRRTAGLRRWLSRGAVVASPFAWKIAAAATAAAATAGGLAAAGALPDVAQRWAAETAARLHIDIPHPDDVTPLDGMLPLSVPEDPAAETRRARAAGVPGGGRPSRSGDAERERREEERERAQERAEDEADAAEERAEDEAEAAEERAEREADAADDRADEAEDRADDEADAREDRADDAADAAEDRADDEADAREDRADDAADAAEEVEEEAEEAADAAQDAAEDRADDEADAAEDAAEDADEDAVDD